MAFFWPGNALAVPPMALAAVDSAGYTKSAMLTRSMDILTHLPQWLFQPISLEAM